MRCAGCDLALLWWSMEPGLTPWLHLTGRGGGDSCNNEPRTRRLDRQSRSASRHIWCGWVQSLRTRLAPCYRGYGCSRSCGFGGQVFPSDAETWTSLQRLKNESDKVWRVTCHVCGEQQTSLTMWDIDGIWWLPSQAAVPMNTMRCEPSVA